jgi:hypothetical protein
MNLFNEFESFSLNFNQYNEFKIENDNCLVVKDQLLISTNCKLKKKYVCQKGILIFIKII